MRRPRAASRTGRGTASFPGSVIGAELLCLLGTAPVAARIVTVGAGALFSERPTEPVYELHGETPPLADWRGYVTLSWTDGSAAPTVITAAERPVIRFGDGLAGLGAGPLWLEAVDYEPEPMLASSTAIPLPLPRTSLVVIGSTLPFEDFDWSRFPWNAPGSLREVGGSTGDLMTTLEGDYELVVRGRVGFRLFVDGEAVNDSWTPPSGQEGELREVRARHPLPDNATLPLRPEYTQGDGPMAVSIEWKTPPADAGFDEAVAVAGRPT